MSYLAASLILLFFLLITVGSYVKIKTVVVIIYSLVSAVLFLLIFRRAVRELFTSPLMLLWLAYCLIGLVSTIFIEKEKDMYILISEASFTFVLFTLTRYVKYEDFFRLFRPFVLILVLIAFFQAATGILVFNFLKAGTQFIAEDKTHGILSIFEYRHYFGCYILLAFFSLFYYPAKQLWINLIYGAIFIVATVMTYTRSIWIAFIFGMLLLIVFALIQLVKKNKSGSRSRKKLSKANWIVLGVFLAALVVLAIIFRDRIAVIVERTVKRITVLNPNQNSWYNRMFTIINGPKYMFQHPYLLPVGGGAGSALKWLAEVEGARFRGAIDCQYVHTFMETGILGLLTFLAMVFYTLVRFFRSRDKAEQLFSLQYQMMALAMVFFEVVVVNSSVFALWVFVLVSLCMGKPGKKGVKQG